jgi:histidyl-tRNA synthetase
MASKPAIPKGTRDFSPSEMQKREYIFDTIRKFFRLYGYQPIETPAMENLSTLLGKYGEEGDKLIFRILNSGDYLSGIDEALLNAGDSQKLSSRISEKGLRYDLTVPFARYVVQHRDEINFPFKRYQIQPVWRADRPQKGRYREFFQCDADVIGSNSLLNEYELVRIIDDIFRTLGIRISIRINNRKVLAGIAEYLGEGSRITDITVAVDKLEKIGIEGVNEELRTKGVSDEAVRKLLPVLELKGTASAKLSRLEELFSGSEAGKKGVEELKTLISYIETGPLSCVAELDLTLARGLNYYTGAIIEVKAADVAIGSICGGGRYDDLTGIFGLPGVSGVGVSFGADRIYDVMEQLGLFGEISVCPAEIMIVNFGDPGLGFAIGILDLLRKKGVRAELYPDPVKLKKQMSYADTMKIPYIIIAGEEEMGKGELTLKSMSTGEQKRIRADELESLLPLTGI